MPLPLDWPCETLADRRALVNRRTVSYSHLVIWHPSIASTAMIEDEIKELERRLAGLRTEHRDLDDVIRHLAGSPNSFDQLKLQRLKKRKLVLKDQIARLENILVPDIIA